MTRMKKSSLLIVFWIGLLMTVLFHSRCYAELDWNFKPPEMLEGDELKKKAEAQVSTNQREEPIRPYVKYSAQGLKNPFQPPISENIAESEALVSKGASKALPALTVQGLLWAGVFPQAIINNTVVKVGDTIGEVTITEIDKEGVSVVFANREYRLRPPGLADKSTQPVRK